MAFNSTVNPRYREAAESSGDWMKEQRDRVALEESQELERKQQELMEQTADHNTPAQRIHIWERRHGLTLPRNPDHPILVIIAKATRLAVGQVREEQQRRLAYASAAVPLSPS